jgi:hypothetical protein
METGVIMTMRISPLYDEIKTRALELLGAESGFIGHSHEEIWSQKTSPWLRHNFIGVAICYARDEVQQREYKKAKLISDQEWLDAQKRTHFTNGNSTKWKLRSSGSSKQGASVIAARHMTVQ